MSLDDALTAATGCKKKIIHHAQVWIDHINNRLAYERAMLAEAGGTAADKFDFAIGGQVRSRGKYFVITKINRHGGAVNSAADPGRKQP